MNANQEQKSVKAPCHDCGGHRNHRVIFVHSEGSDDPNEYQWSRDYEIIQCVGCDSVRFRIVTGSEDHIDHESGRYIPDIAVYPVPAKQNWRARKELYAVPISGRIYREVVAAIDNNSNLLAAAGLRACVEAICKDKAIPGKNLETKIEGLVSSGMLAKPQADLLHEARFLGNSALHELKPPEDEEILLVTDIVETMMHTMYVLPVKVRGMRESRQDTPDDSVEQG